MSLFVPAGPNKLQKKYNLPTLACNFSKRSDVCGDFIYHLFYSSPTFIISISSEYSELRYSLFIPFQIHQIFLLKDASMMQSVAMAIACIALNCIIYASGCLTESCNCRYLSIICSIRIRKMHCRTAVTTNIEDQGDF